MDSSEQYTWRESHPPQLCTRQELVDLIFDVGEEREYNYHTILLAVMLADVGRAEYSIELAYTSLLLASKWYEYEDRMTTREALVACDNYYPVQLEWEMIGLLPLTTPLELLYRWTGCQLAPQEVYRLASIPALGLLDPRAVLVGVLLLQQRGHL